MSTGAPKPFKLSIKKTAPQQPSQQNASSLGVAAVKKQQTTKSADGVGQSIASRGPVAGQSKPAGLSLKGASQSSGLKVPGAAGGAPKSGFLKLKGQGQAPSAAATPSPAPRPATTPSTGPKLGLGLKLKGQGSKPAATPASQSSLKQQAMAIALGVQQDVTSVAPAPKIAPKLTPRPASTPSVPRAATTASTPAAPASAATPSSTTAPRKFGIKLKGSAGPKPPLGANSSAPSAAYTHNSAATPAAKPRISLNKSRGIGSVHKPYAASAANQYSYQHYEHQYNQPSSHYEPLQTSTAAAGGYDYGSMPLDSSYGAAAAATPAYPGGATDTAVPASVPDYSSYDAAYGGGYADGYGGGYVAQKPAKYRQATGHKRGRPPGGSRPRDVTGLGGAIYQAPLGPRTKKPKLGAFRDREKEEESEDEDFNPKAERLNARRVAAAAAARHRPAAGNHRNSYNRAATTGHRAASNRAAAAVAAAAARHAHAAAAAANAAPPPRPQPAAPAAPAALDADAPMSAAAAAAAFAAMTSTADGAAAFGLDDIDDEDAAAAAAAPTPKGPAAPPAHPSAPAAVAAHMRGGAAAVPTPVRPKGPLVDPQLLHEVNSIEETNLPTHDTMMKLLHAVDKRDKYRFFVQPVTDAVAPGYSKVIKHPMDLSTMKSKVDRGVYNTWADLQSDLVLMFTNAKTYNQAHTVVYKQADLLLTAGLKMVKNFKQGKMKVRGFQGNVPTGGLPGSAAAAAADTGNQGKAEAAPAAGKPPATREKRERAEAPPIPSGPMVTRQTRRGRPRREDEAPVQKKIRGSRFIPLAQATTDANNAAGDGNDFRDTYRSQPRVLASAWRGLADGANPEGVPYGGNGRPVLRCIAGHINNLPPESYLRSLTRFVSGAGSAVEKLVMQLYGSNLQLLVPVKGVNQAQLQQRTAAGQPQQAPLPHQLQQQHQQLQQSLQQQQQQQQAGQQQHQLRLPVAGAAGGGAGIQTVQIAGGAQQLLQQQQQLLQASQGPAAAGASAGIPQVLPAQNAAVTQQLQRQQQQQVPQQFVPGPHTAHFLAAAGMPGLAGIGSTAGGRPQVPQQMQAAGLTLPVGIAQQR